MIQRAAFLLIIIGVGILLFPVRTYSPEKQSPAPKRLAEHWILPVPIPLPTLNPLRVLSATEKSLMLLNFSRLVKTGDQLQVEPDTLEKWSFDVTTKRLTLSLRPDVVFHDGKPLTTRDVIFSFHEWAASSSLDRELLEVVRGAAAFSKGKASTISGIHRIDDLRFEIELDESAGAERLIHSLSQARFCLFPEGYRGKTIDEFFSAPIGTGPFKVLSHTPDKVEYVSHPQYFFGPPSVHQLTLQRMAPDDAVAAFRRREVNNLIMYHLSDVASLHDKDVVIKRLARANTYTIIFNTLFPPFRDEAVRKQIALRVPKERIVRECFPGAELANQFIPAGMMGGRPSIDVAKSPPKVEPPALPPARPVVPPLVFYTLYDENGECTAKAIREVFAPLAITVEVSNFKHLFDKLKANKLFFWAEGSEFKSDDPYQILHYFTKGSGEFLLGNPVPFVEQAFSRLTLNPLSPLERADLYQKIDRYLVDHFHIVPVLHFDHYVVYRNNVQGLDFLRTGRFAANWYKIQVLENGAAE